MPLFKITRDVIDINEASRERSSSFILLARRVTVPGEHLFEKYAGRGEATRREIAFDIS